MDRNEECRNSSCITFRSVPTLRNRLEYCLNVCHPIRFSIPNARAAGLKYLRRIACPQYGLRPRFCLLRKPNHPPLGTYSVLSTALASRRHVDAEVQAFAKTRSFTLPSRLAPLVLQNKKILYDLLFRTSAETLLEVARHPIHLGADIGFFSVLHTWSQKLKIHPHVHCVVPAGGLSPDHTRWVRSRDNYFLPQEVLREVFRGKFVDALEQAFQNGQLNFQGDLKLLAQPKIFAAWLRPLYRQDWVVYLKRPFGGPEHVLQYLGRYTHRVAISNHRLVSFADGQVTFRWRDSTHHNEQKLLPLSLDEFLCRFLLHILPQGFVRIRHFGFLANRRRTHLLPLCFQLLGSTPQPPAEQLASSTEDSSDSWRCPKCGGPMRVIERLTVAEIQLRSPPVVTAAA